MASEIVLQFIEILTQHPDLAGSAFLRLLPIADPVALELGKDAPGLGNWDLLDHAVDTIRSQSADGYLEVDTDEGGGFRLEGEAPPTMIRAVEIVRAATTEAGPGDRSLFPERLEVRRTGSTKAGT